MDTWGQTRYSAWHMLRNSSISSCACTVIHSAVLQACANRPSVPKAGWGSRVDSEISETVLAHEWLPRPEETSWNSSSCGPELSWSWAGLCERTEHFPLSWGIHSFHGAFSEHAHPSQSSDPALCFFRALITTS